MVINMKEKMAVRLMPVIMAGVLTVGIFAGCGKEVDYIAEELDSMPDNVLSVNTALTEMPDNSEKEVIIEEPAEEDTVSENIPDAEITEEEIHNLLAENYFCVSNIFIYGRLDSDESRREGNLVPVADERFSSYDDLENYLKSIYVDEEVDNLMNMNGYYFELRDEFWMRTDKEMEEMPAEWKSYQEGYIIEEVDVEGNQGKIVIRLDNPENEEWGYKLIFRATYEDGWRLNKMVSQAALCGYVKQGEQYTYKIWEVGDENNVWCYKIFVYDGEELVQVIVQDNDTPSPASITEKIWEVDINFDGTLDLMLYCGLYGNQSAALYDCYVFDEGQFLECSCGRIGNPSIDEENQLIIDWGRASAISYEEHAYRVVGIDFEMVWSKYYVYDEELEELVIQSEHHYETHEEESVYEKE